MMSANRSTNTKNHLNEQMPSLNRNAILGELDGKIYSVTDEWLMRYVLHLIDLIVERFNEKMVVSHNNSRCSADCIDQSSFGKITRNFPVN